MWLLVMGLLLSSTVVDSPSIVLIHFLSRQRLRADEWISNVHDCWPIVGSDLASTSAVYDFSNVVYIEPEKVVVHGVSIYALVNLYEMIRPTSYQWRI